MKRPPKMRTPDHTRLNLGQEKYYCPFIEGYIKLLQTNLKRVKHIGHNYSYTTYTCGQSHEERNPNGNHSGISGIIVSGLVMIFLWFGISYLNASVVNWFVNVRCCKIMRNSGEWNWNIYLVLILADRKGGDWSWFRLLFDLLYWSGCLCVMRLLISNRILDFHGMDL